MIASKLTAEVYGLKVAKADIEDAEHNTTRFIVLAAKPVRARKNDGPVITSFVFRVRNVPAALYKTLGGFASVVCASQRVLPNRTTGTGYEFKYPTLRPALEALE